MGNYGSPVEARLGEARLEEERLEEERLEERRTLVDDHRIDPLWAQEQLQVALLDGQLFVTGQPHRVYLARPCFGCVCACGCDFYDRNLASAADRAASPLLRRCAVAR